MLRFMALFWQAAENFPLFWPVLGGLLVMMGLAWRAQLVADRSPIFWLIAAIGLVSAIVAESDFPLPLWARFVFTAIGGVAAVWVVADTVRYSMRTIRAARERRRSHGH